MNFLQKKFLLEKNIKKLFPCELIKYCYAYGSAVIPQKDNKGKMIDLFFIVDDLEKFHKENLRVNHHHYSNLSKHFGNGKIIEVNKQGTCVYYNPNIKLCDDILIKYGVMSYSDFIFKLKNWDNLFVAGRFHKPVSCIELNTRENKEDINEMNEVNDLLYKNRKSAFSLCALKNKSEVNTVEFFIDLAKLSYIGDIRTHFKAEKKDKIKNVVLGALDSYMILYKPIFEEFDVKIRGDMLVFDEKHNDKYFHNIPNLFMTNLQLHINDYNSKSKFENQFQSYKTEKRREIIDNYIKSLNLKYSIYGVMSGIFTTNTSDSIQYLLEKYKKVFFN